MIHINPDFDLFPRAGLTLLCRPTCRPTCRFPWFRPVGFCPSNSVVGRAERSRNGDECLPTDLQTSTISFSFFISNAHISSNTRISKRFCGQRWGPHCLCALPQCFQAYSANPHLPLATGRQLGSNNVSSPHPSQDRENAFHALISQSDPSELVQV